MRHSLHFLILVSACWLLTACGITTIETRPAEQPDPELTATPVGLSGKDQYEMKIEWKGLGNKAFQIFRSEEVHEPYDYREGNSTTDLIKIYTSKSGENLFTDPSVTVGKWYQYYLMDESSTFRVGPVRAYVAPDWELSEASPPYAYYDIPHHGRIFVPGGKPIKVPHLFLRAVEVIFESGAHIHLKNAPSETAPGGSPLYCSLFSIVAQRSRGNLKVTAENEACVKVGEIGGKFENMGYFLHITDPGDTTVDLGSGANASVQNPYLACLALGPLKPRWVGDCDVYDKFFFHRNQANPPIDFPQGYDPGSF